MENFFDGFNYMDSAWEQVTPRINAVIVSNRSIYKVTDIWLEIKDFKSQINLKKIKKIN